MNDKNLASRFEELRAKTEQQMQIIDAAVGARLSAAGYSGLQREVAEETFREEAITGCDWCNENYEGRASAPELPFRQIQNLVHELAPMLANAQPLSPAQRIGLEFALLVANIRVPF